MKHRRSTQRFLNLSFKRKLVLLTTATSGIALLLATTIFALFDAWTARATLLHNVELTAELIGANSTAMLMFRDRSSAVEILRVLETQRNIETAAIYEIDGTLFASYARADVPVTAPAWRPAKQGYTFQASTLALFSPIRHQGKLVGMLYLTSDLRDLYIRLGEIVALLAVSFTLITFAAYKFSSRYQHLVSGPILHLASAARNVSQHRDYSLRVEKLGTDEVGELTDGFNEMLEAVQAREEALQSEIAIRRHAQEELRDLATRLERSNRELQDFASVASHDLQEPLRKVQAFADRLARTLGDAMDERSRDYMERMLNATLRMQNLINDLLTYSRITSKAQPFTRVDLGKIVAGVLGDLEIRIEQAGATIDVQPLPRIDADDTQMRQLFQNLIGNALKFSRAGVAPRVRISMEPEAGAPKSGNGRPAFTTVIVSDNGIGFDEKYREQIFIVFQRLHGRTDYEGTGIGLAVCKKIVVRHGGSIEAGSVEGEGATFRIRLPLSQPEATANC